MEEFEENIQGLTSAIKKYIKDTEFIKLYKNIENNYACFWEQSYVKSDIAREQKNFEMKVNEIIDKLKFIQKDLFDQLSKENSDEVDLVKENLKRNEIKVEVTPTEDNPKKNEVAPKIEVTPEVTPKVEVTPTENSPKKNEIIPKVEVTPAGDSSKKNEVIPKVEVTPAEDSSKKNEIEVTPAEDSPKENEATLTEDISEKYESER